jgi:hypothetical protein
MEWYGLEIGLTEDRDQWGDSCERGNELAGSIKW